MSESLVPLCQNEYPRKTEFDLYENEPIGRNISICMV